MAKEGGNPFDQFDDASTGSNPFDQFDEPVAPGNPGALATVRNYALAGASKAGQGIMNTVAGAAGLASAPQAQTRAMLSGGAALLDRHLRDEPDLALQQMARDDAAAAEEQTQQNAMNNPVARVAAALRDGARERVQALGEFDRNFNPELVRQQQAIGDAKGFAGTLQAMKDNPLATLGTFAESAPGMALGVGVAGAAGKAASALGAGAAGAARAAGAAGTLSEAGVSAMQAREGLRAGVLATPHAELAAASPRYQELVQEGVAPTAARALLAEEVSNAAALPAAAATALGSVLTHRMFGDVTAKMAAGQAVTAREAIKNVGQETVEEALQGAGEDYAQHRAMLAADAQHEMDWGGSLAQNMAAGFGMSAPGSAGGWAMQRVNTARGRSPDGSARADAAAQNGADNGHAAGAGATNAPAFDYAQYQAFRRALESGGNATAKNPRSTAYGADQFTRGTWLDVVRQAKPEWAEGMSEAELLEQRANPERSAEMAAVLDERNALVLRSAGQPVNAFTLYAAHHFGAGKAVAFAKADGSTLMDSILTEGQLKANPYLKGKTKDWALANWSRRGGMAPDGAAPASAADLPAGMPELAGQAQTDSETGGDAEFDAATAQTQAAQEALQAPSHGASALERAMALDKELAETRQRHDALARQGDDASQGERAALRQQIQDLQSELDGITGQWPAMQPGKAVSFTTEAGARLDGHYALVDAASLVTSHDENLRVNPQYPPQLQPRQRERAASEMQISGIASRLDPARLGAAADAATGAPIVGADGLVESGNARTIALKRIYQQQGQKAAEYKGFLQAHAHEFGLDGHQVASMQQPVLVRVRDTPVNRAEFARQANASTVAALSPAEQAHSDAQRIDSMQDLLPDEDGEFSGPASRGFVRRFMARLPATEQAGMLDASGQLSSAGYARVRNAVLAKAYGNSPVLSRMTESLDDNTRNFSRALMMAAPEVAKMRQAMQAGARHEADITSDLVAAVEELSRLRDDGLSVQQALSQAGIFGDKYSPETRELMQYLAENARRPRRIADLIKAYWQALDAVGDPRQVGMFGANVAPAKGQLLQAAKRAVQTQYPQGSDHEQHARTAERGQPGASQPAQSAASGRAGDEDTGRQGGGQRTDAPGHEAGSAKPQGQPSTDVGQARFSRQGQAPDATDAERQFKQAERLYGGKEAYDRAKAAGQTKLDYRQWVQVRTPAFKAWFGDWQAQAHRQFLDGEPVQQLSGREFAPDGVPLTQKVPQWYQAQGASVVQVPGIGEVRLDETAVRNSLSHGMGRDKASAFAAVPQVLRQGRIIHREELRGSRGAGRVFHVAAPVRMGGRDFVADVLVKSDNNASRMYVHEVALKEKLQQSAFKTGADAAEAGVRAGTDSGAVRSVLEGIYAVKPDSVSKVVDPETGEPLVVYHGTQHEFQVFDTPLGMQRIFLTKSKDFAVKYGKIHMPLFVNARNVLNVDYKGQNAFDEIAVNGKTLEDIEELANYARDAGYDGLLADNVQDAGTASSKLSVNDEVIVFNPNQIKSAIGNTGAFSGNSNDIRYSRKDETRAAYESRIDELFAGAPPALDGVRVLDRSDVLSLLGMGEGPVRLAEGKVIAGIDNHPRMTAKVWKQIPEWIENPAAVFESDTAEGLVFLAPETLGDAPVSIIVRPNGAQKGALQAHLLLNAYDRSARTPFMRWIHEGLLKYADTKKFPALFQRTSGRQLPGTALRNKPGTERIVTENNLAGWRKEQASKASQPALRNGGSAHSSREAEPGQAASDALVAEVQKQAEQTVKRWSNAPQVVAVASMQDERIPEAVRQQDAAQKSQGASGEPEGFFYGGKVYLLASQLPRREDLARVVMHEALGHYGLRGVFGRRLAVVLDELAHARPREMTAKARAYGLHGLDRQTARTASHTQIWQAMTQEQRMEAAEEVLAELAQSEPQIGYVRRAVAAIRSWLRTHVPALADMRYSDDEIIRNFILPARRWVQRGGSAKAGEGGRAAASPSHARSDWERAANEASQALDFAGRSVQQLAREYASLPGTDGGHVIDADMVRELSPEYRQDRTRAAQIHRAVSDLSQKLLARALARPVADGRDPVVVFTAGGGGSGKSTAIRLLMGESDADVTLDGTFSKLDKARRQIEQALASGRSVEIRYVYRSPAKSAKGAIERAIASGRPVPIEALAKAHANAPKVVKALAKEYAGNKHVKVIAINNDGPAITDAHYTRIEEIPDVDENSAREQFQRAVDAAYRRASAPASLEGNGAKRVLDNDPGRFGQQPATRRTIPERPQGGRAQQSLDAVGSSFTPELYRAFTGHWPPGYVAPKARFSRAANDEASAAERAQALIDAPARGTARPLEALARAVTRYSGVEAITKGAGRVAAKALDKFTPETIKAGLVADYGLPQEAINARVLMQGRKLKQLRETGSLVQKLSTLTNQEAELAYDWMTSKDSAAVMRALATLPQEQVQVLQQVREMVDALGREAVELGLLSETAYQRNKGAYLHRSYEKHVLGAPDAKAGRRGQGGATSVLGANLHRRGLDATARMEQVRQSAPEWWDIARRQGKADPDLIGRKLLKLERRAPSGEGNLPLDGMEGKQPGRVREVVYVPASQGVPARYADFTPAGVWEVQGVQGESLQLWRDYTAAEREQMGEIKDVRYAIMSTLHGMIADVETARYLRWVAREYAVPEGAEVDGKVVDATENYTRAFRPDEWVQVPDTNAPGTRAKKYGALAGKYVPGPIWNDIRHVARSGLMIEGAAGEAWHTMMQLWKTSKTALSPTVHVNNIMSNFVMADWADVSMGHIGKAMNIIMGAHDLQGQGWLGRGGNALARAIGMEDRAAAHEIVNRYKDSGGELGSWTISDTMKGQLEPVIAKMQAQLAASDADLGAQIGMAAALQHLLQGQVRSAAQAAKGSKLVSGTVREVGNMIDLYGNEDAVFRLAAWLKAKEEGKSDIEAGRIAREAFLDYNINAPWVQLAKSTALPFVSFSYRGIPMLARVATQKPHKLLKLMMVASALNQLGLMLAGGADDDQVRRLLPDEKAGGIWGMVPKLVRMPWNDVHGSPVFLDIRRWIPLGDIVDIGQGHAVLPIPPTLMPTGPLALFGELLLNKSAFTGSPITLETDTGKEKLDKVTKHLWQSFAPNVPGLPYTYATQNILNAINGKTDAFGREQSVPMAIASSFGVKLGAYPPDVLKRNVVFEAKRQEAEIRKGVAAIRRQIATGGISSEEGQEDIAAQAEKLKAVRQKALEKLGG